MVPGTKKQNNEETVAQSLFSIRKQDPMQTDPQLTSWVLCGTVGTQEQKLSTGPAHLESTGHSPPAPPRHHLSPSEARAPLSLLVPATYLGLVHTTHGQKDYANPPHVAHGVRDKALRGPLKPKGQGTHFSSGQANSVEDPSGARQCPNLHRTSRSEYFSQLLHLRLFKCIVRRFESGGEAFRPATFWQPLPVLVIYVVSMRGLPPWSVPSPQGRDYPHWLGGEWSGAAAYASVVLNES
ncbi:Hypothetical predicted protein [Pelobates cultripes]|uniref:Uncharacterized protein n=1 Tax=Pelobates cultripes TaxID=61616 RepID=A0AAD1REL8_PELCU|nr:Hypothetical predicted protein [Pelobates cultripes]